MSGKINRITQTFMRTKSCYYCVGQPLISGLEFQRKNVTGVCGASHTVLLVIVSEVC